MDNKKNKDRGYTLLVSRGIDAGREYYYCEFELLLLPLLLLAMKKDVPEELGAEPAPDMSHLPEILRHWDDEHENPSPYLVFIDGQVAFKPSYRNDDGNTVGILTIPSDAPVYIKDGWYRLDALGRALEDDPTLERSAIPVFFFVVSQLKKVREDQDGPVMEKRTAIKRSPALRFKRMGRILRIFMEEGSVSLPWLSEHFGVSPRTIRRDLLFLRLADYPIHEMQEGAYEMDREPVKHLEVLDDCMLAVIIQESQLWRLLSTGVLPRIRGMLKIFMEQDSVSGASLSERFKVTPGAIRSDLQLMRASGFSIREVREGIHALDRDSARHLEGRDDDTLDWLLALRFQDGLPFRVEDDVVDRLRRMLKIFMTQRRVSRARLGRQFKVKPLRIKRDVRLLEASGLPIREVREGIHALDRDAARLPDDFSDDLLILLLAFRFPSSQPLKVADDTAIRLGLMLKAFAEKGRVEGPWLCERFKMTPREIHWDLLLLNVVGFPIRETQKNLYELNQTFVRQFRNSDANALINSVARRLVVQPSRERLDRISDRITGTGSELKKVKSLVALYIRACKGLDELMQDGSQDEPE